MEQFFGTLKLPKLIFRGPFIQKKFPHTVLKIISAQITWINFYFENIFFQGVGTFFATAKPLIWASFFPTKN